MRCSAATLLFGTFDAPKRMSSSSVHYCSTSLDRLTFDSSLISHAGCMENLESIVKSHALVALVVDITVFQSCGCTSK